MVAVAIICLLVHSFTAMNVLVTGGTGYIGSHTAIELFNAGHDVEIIDDLSNSKVTVLDKIEKIAHKRPRFYLGDCTNRSAVAEVFDNSNIDAVIHMAGYKAVAESVEQPLKYYQNNLVCTLNLLFEMKSHNVNKFLFSSSATVYGDPGHPGYTEDLTTGINLTNPYGRTKYMIEEILKDTAFADKDLEVTLLRYFNPIGCHPSGLIGEDPNGIPNNLMPVIMRVAQGKLPELKVFGNDYNTSDGSCLRDYIHVVDLAKGHLAALNHMKPGTSIYNLGTGKGTSVLEMVSMFEKISKKKLPHKIVGRRTGDLPVVYANPAKAERELEWKTELTVEDAMRDTLRFLDYQRKHPEGSGDRILHPPMSQPFRNHPAAGRDRPQTIDGATVNQPSQSPKFILYSAMAFLLLGCLIVSRFYLQRRRTAASQSTLRMRGGL